MIAGDAEGIAAASWLFESFPVVVEETRFLGQIPAPHPLEAEQVVGAVETRRTEFAAGRFCARRALARLGIRDFALLNGADRAPRWPVGVVGAITHTGRKAAGEGSRYCGVVVARRQEVLTVGLDAEEAKPLHQPLWARVLTAAELRPLDPSDGQESGLRAKVIFSAKECFYKAQYPLSQRFLRFQDVEITLDLATSTFQADITDGAPAGLPLTRCWGRFLSRDGFVLTGIVLRA